MLYSKSESGPPGQYTQMLPVNAICGQRCGLHMTATTAMPLALRIGLARNAGTRIFLCVSGIAAMISVSLGTPPYPCFLHEALRIAFNETDLDSSCAWTSCAAISAHTRRRHSADVEVDDTPMSTERVCTKEEIDVQTRMCR